MRLYVIKLILLVFEVLSVSSCPTLPYIRLTLASPYILSPGRYVFFCLRLLLTRLFLDFYNPLFIYFYSYFESKHFLKDVRE